MAGPYTVDASVFLNAFNPSEAGHAASHRFLEYLRSEAIPTIAPTLLLPEVAATIKRGRGDERLAREFAAALVHLPHLVFVPLDQALAQKAAEVAARHGLRGSDAVYATVAMRFGSALVTLDRDQRERVGAVIRAYTPSLALADLE